jgi:TPR repeat protein
MPHEQVAIKDAARQWATAAGSSSDDDDADCAICFQPFLNPVFPCWHHPSSDLHRYCSTCVKEMRERGVKVPCPLCNARLHPDEYDPVFVQTCQLQVQGRRAGPRAELCYKKACRILAHIVEHDPDHALAWFNLGCMHFEGRGTAQSNEEALDCFKTAGALEYALGQNCCGVMFFKGIGCDADVVAAVDWWTQAATQGLPEAQYHLAMRYFNGEGVEKELTKAAEWCRRCTLHEEEPLDFCRGPYESPKPVLAASWVLGNMYEDGHGVPVDYEVAVVFWKRAAEEGYAPAQFNMSTVFTAGKKYGVKQSDEKAAVWAEKSAVQGHADAQNKIGVMYEKGLGVGMSYKKAFKYYFSAAAQEQREALCHLGCFYMKVCVYN